MFYHINISMLHFFHVFFSCCAFSMLHFFHVALFSICNFFMLHFLILKNIQKMNGRQETQPKKTTLHSVPWTCFTFIWYPITHFCHYIVLNDWESEKEPIYSFVGDEYVCQGLKLLKLGCELKFISPHHKILLISCRYFNYAIESE